MTRDAVMVPYADAAVDVYRPTVWNGLSVILIHWHCAGRQQLAPVTGRDGALSSN